VLAKNVEMFGFEFWGQDPKSREWKWLDHWDSTNSLPALVHVGLGLGTTGKRGQPQDVVHRYVALPATAVQPDWQVPGGFGAANTINRLGTGPGGTGTQPGAGGGPTKIPPGGGFK
jgi:hypothetical protein